MLEDEDGVVDEVDVVDEVAAGVAGLDEEDVERESVR